MARRETPGNQRSPVPGVLGDRGDYAERQDHDEQDDERQALTRPSCAGTGRLPRALEGREVRPAYRGRGGTPPGAVRWAAWPRGAGAAGTARDGTGADRGGMDTVGTVAARGAWSPAGNEESAASRSHSRTRLEAAVTAAGSGTSNSAACRTARTTHAGADFMPPAKGNRQTMSEVTMTAASTPKGSLLLAVSSRCARADARTLSWPRTYCWAFDAAEVCAFTWRTNVLMRVSNWSLRPSMVPRFISGQSWRSTSDV